MQAASCVDPLCIPVAHVSIVSKLVPKSVVCNAYLDLNQESDRFPAVKQAVIVCKCKVHHLKKSQYAQPLETVLVLTGLISIFPSTTTGLSLIACRPSTAVCGRLMIGVPIIDPNTPPLEMVKVPPAMSSIESLPSRAYHRSACYTSLC